MLKFSYEFPEVVFLGDLMEFLLVEEEV